MSLLFNRPEWMRCVSPTIRDAWFFGGVEALPALTSNDNARKKLYAQIPLGKPGTAKQVARAVLYLVGEEYITGQVLTMDGRLS